MVKSALTASKKYLSVFLIFVAAIILNFVNQEYTFAAQELNTGLSISNLKVMSGGTVVLANGEISCDQAYSFDFDWSIESDTPFVAGQTAYARIASEVGSEVYGYRFNNTAPIAIVAENDSSKTVAEWYLNSGGGFNIRILEDGAGQYYLEGHTNTGQMIRSTCAVEDVWQNIGLGFGQQPAVKQDAKQRVLLKKGTFRQQENYAQSQSVTNMAAYTSVFSPKDIIDELYKNGGNQVISSDKTINNLYEKVVYTDNIDIERSTVTIAPRVPMPVGGNDFESGIAQNGDSVNLAECTATRTTVCKKKITQIDGETEQEFIARLRDAREDKVVPYGFYVSGDTTSVIIYFGDMPSGITYDEAARGYSTGYNTFKDYFDLNHPFDDDSLWEGIEARVGNDNVYGGKVTFYAVTIAAAFTNPLVINGQAVPYTVSWHYNRDDTNQTVVDKNYNRISYAVIGDSTGAITKGSVILSVIDKDLKTPISGATFQLYNANGQAISEIETTDTNGKIQVNGLDSADGYYWVQVSVSGDCYQSNNTNFYTDTTLATEISDGKFSIVGDTGTSLVATNERKTVTIRFDGGEHANSSFATRIPAQTRKIHELISVPNSDLVQSLAQTGWIFTGWDKEIQDEATEDVTYTAQWKAELINISARIIWDDNDNEENLRPTDPVYAIWLINGRVVDQTTVFDENWVADFGPQYKYLNGEPVSYSVRISTIPNYTYEIGDVEDGVATIMAALGQDEPAPEEDIPETPNTSDSLILYLVATVALVGLSGSFYAIHRYRR